MALIGRRQVSLNFFHFQFIGFGQKSKLLKCPQAFNCCLLNTLLLNLVHVQESANYPIWNLCYHYNGGAD